MSVSNTAARLRRILTVFRFLFTPEYLTIRSKEPESDIVLWLPRKTAILPDYCVTAKISSFSRYPYVKSTHFSLP